MLGADFYETDLEKASLLAEGGVPIGIGENTRIKYQLLTPLSLSFFILREILLSSLISQMTPVIMLYRTETASLTKMPE